ncbi:GAF domain-containing protein [Nocardia sp. alder85J]|uniref:GAF domain-containing protein n=1 Tax=Nocardia sp. alder85J TaxID=2862949 RepID=UPI001CD37B86|nr:GAF domain-containing protein [Nocardia sp. alder85J]MCX4091846.1 GAF domain-containing protein [Nocardia sp. alder85J]
MSTAGREGPGTAPTTPEAVSDSGTAHFVDAGASALLSRMQAVVEGLRAGTAADRTTLRIDLPEAGCSVATCAAESCAAGVRSIRRDASLPQRDLETVRWIEQHRTLLVQPDFSVPPHPPQALLEVYGVGAQMLAPIVRDGVMVAWLSVHSMAERPWSEADRAAVTAAAERIGDLLSYSE